MGLLDGLQETFGKVFGAIFRDGGLRKVTLIDNGKGGYSSSHVDHPVKVLIETCNDEQRLAEGYSDKDASLIILRYGVAVDLNLDDLVYAESKWWAVKAPLVADPVQAAWIVRGQPAQVDGVPDYG